MNILYAILFIVFVVVHFTPILDLILVKRLYDKHKVAKEKALKNTENDEVI